MGDGAGPGPDDVVIDGIWVGESQGGGCNESAGGCALFILVAITVPPLLWWAMSVAAGPADPEAPASAAVAWGIGWLWAVVTAWVLLVLVVSSAYAMGRSMTAAMLWFEGAFGLTALLIAVAA